MSHLISLSLLVLKNIAHVGSYRNLMNLVEFEEIGACQALPACVVNVIHTKALSGMLKTESE